MEFKPQRSRKTGKVIWILSAAFIIFNGWMFLFAGASAGFAMSGASILLLLFIVFETGRFGWSYKVNDNGITVKRTFKKYFISFENIDSIKEINREGIGKLVAELQKRKGKSGQKESGVSLQIELGRLIGHSSVPINIAELKSGPHRRRAGRNVSVTQQFILVTKKDGKQFILTPLDIKGFLKECRLTGRQLKKGAN
ncbi:MAG: hypothetical protein RBT69_09895 [Spirochaetia bacterium]|jgi:hypothetical protein|nr:hypothetical protein [Spirochaetia bacterium]